MTSQFAKALTVGGALLVSTAGTGAFAADLGPYQPYNPPAAPVVQYSEPSIWQGAYIGINGGYGWSNSTFTKPEGGFGGGQIGYNWQRDWFVFGLEGDFQGADISGRAFDQFGDTAHSSVNWFSTVRGRLGYASGPFLVYGTAGLAVAEFDTGVNLGAGLNFRNTDTKAGYAAGGGVEWAFAPNWSMKAEYLYTGFGDDTLSSGDRINYDFQTVRVGLNYKFW
ncbi:MAG TPA: porin family protein [Hyphomicrobium sp.]|nr:porin family protein [Hyphomicrobium sp.]